MAELIYMVGRDVTWFALKSTYNVGYWLIYGSDDSSKKLQNDVAALKENENKLLRVMQSMEERDKNMAEQMEKLREELKESLRQRREVVQQPEPEEDTEVEYSEDEDLN